MKLLLSIIMMCCLSKVYSQQREDDYKRMIDSAINLKVSDLFKHTKSTKNLYLMNEDNMPYILGSTSSGMKFKYMNVYSQEGKNILKKGVFAWKIFTSLRDNKFTITIVDFKITYKNNDYKFSNGGGSKTLFHYSCENNKWILIESKGSGI